MRRKVVYRESERESAGSYGCLHFLWDIFMVALTGGLWLIWIFVREMRKR